MRRSLLLLPLCLVVALLAGCGQKGPLVPPLPKPGAASSTVQPSAPAPAISTPAPATSSSSAAPASNQH